jgi:hypothetical protein
VSKNDTNIKLWVKWTEGLSVTWITYVTVMEDGSQRKKLRETKMNVEVITLFVGVGEVCRAGDCMSLT